MKKYVVMLMVVVMMLSLVACSSAPSNGDVKETPTKETKEEVVKETKEEPAKEEVKEKVKIVLGATGLMEDQFTQVLQQGYKDGAEEIGVELLVANSQSSLDKEAEMINNFIQAGVAAMIIEPVSPDASVAMAELAIKKDIPVFACAIGINSDKIFASSVNDNYDLGESTGTAAIPFLEKQYGKDTEIKTAILTYDSQDPEGSGARVQGFQDMVKDYNLNYVARQVGFMPDDAFQVATDILTANPDLNMIYCANEGGVVGAVNAIKAAKKEGQVFVFGVDCSVQICDMLLSDDNICQAVTAQDPYQQGKYAVKTMYEYIVNGVEPEVKAMKVDGILVVRGDEAGINAFADNWKARSGQ